MVKLGQLMQRSEPREGLDEEEVSASAAGIVCITTLQSHLDSTVWSSLLAAAAAADWATCVKVVGSTFGISPASASTLEALRRAAAADRSTWRCPMSWWVDPRVGDECWAQRSPREQWVSLASFLSHVIGRLKHVADEWAGDSRARQRMAVVLCRGGYVQEALGVSRSDWSLAVTDVLMTSSCAPAPSARSRGATAGRGASSSKYSRKA